MTNIPVQSDDFQPEENRQNTNQANNQTNDSQFGLVDNSQNVVVSSGDDSTDNNSASSNDLSDDMGQSDAPTSQPVEPMPADSSEQEINDSLAASNSDNSEMPKEQLEAKTKMEEATKQANDALGDMFNALGDESEAEDLEKSSSENTDQSAQESSPQANNSMPNSAPETQEKEDDPAGEADQAL